MFFGAVLVSLLVSGSHANAQSVSQGDYDVDDNRLIEISNLEQLDAVRYDLDGDGVPESGGDREAYTLAFPSAAARMGCPARGCDGYELTHDLDFDDPGSYASGSVDRGWSRGEGGEGWPPIGIHFVRFTSTFDGNDHTIAHLFIDRVADDYVGLFGGIDSAGSIRQLGLVDAVVRGGASVGPLAGANDGTIVGCYATATVLGNDRVGGLVGANNEANGTIIDSYAASSVFGTGAIGGLAGGNWNTILGSHAMGDVSGSDAVGGLVGWNSGPISNSYATGNVWGTNAVGGLVGNNNSRGVIVSSYATGNVSGGDGGQRVGGLVGENFDTIRGSYATGRVFGWRDVGGLVGSSAIYGTTISSYATGVVSGGFVVGGLAGRSDDTSVTIGSYATGGVSGSSRVGGLVGWNGRSNGISFSYWNVETSGQAQGVGDGFMSGAAGKTTAELQAPTSYAGIYRNWNTDIDDADGDGLEATGADDPWDFGTGGQYPALRADFDGDGEATWEEFGPQHSAESPPVREPPLPPTIPRDPPDAYPETCTNGRVVENPQENPGLVGDCRILLDGRDTLAGRATLNWSTGVPISRWQGTTIEGSPARVVELKLISAGLSGQIPPRLGELSALRVLSFRSNDLRGGIPPELAGLSELRDLDFHGNLLGGMVPPELANLSKLEALNLNAAGLTGPIPPGLSKLSNLKRLDLGQNDLTGPIPAQLAALPNLEWLQLHKNHLTGVIPRELGNLTHLEVLSLSYNLLTGTIPSELGRLSNLQSLGLEENGLTGQIPQELGNLSKLYGLSLGNNQLTGEIPTWLSGLSHMDSIRLHGNQLTGPIPAGLGDLSRLNLLYLHGNQLTGAIPPALGRLSRLGHLKLDNNKLTGRIPAELGNLPNLEVLDLGNNDLTGVIPRRLGNLHNLEFLVLENNELTGNIPAELSGLSNLRYMRLKGNHLTGPIPAELTALSSLVELDTTGTDLTGCVPWHLAQKPILDIKHDGLRTCAPPVAEGDSFSVEASRLVGDDSLTIVAVGDAAHGTVFLDGATINYEHDGSETTTDSFSYIATDGTNTVTTTVTTTVEVTVTPVNDSPVAVPDTAGVDEGDTLYIEAPALLHNDTDVEDDTLTITAVGDAVNGTVSLDGTTVVYEHDGSETTAGSFTYTVTDGTDTDTATVEVTVTPVNDPPIAVPDTAAVNEGDTVSMEASALLDNDTDIEGDPLSLAAVGDAANGTVFLDGTTIIYEHGGSETTADTFIYVVSDGMSTATTTVEMIVTPVNDPPVATPDTAAVDEGDTLSIEVPVLLDNDTDAEDDTLTITVVGSAINGNVSLDGTTITYEHDGSETAAGSFAYIASDGTDTATAMVTVTVTPVNDPPVAVGDSVTVDEGGTLSIEASVLLDNDADAEDDTLTITVVGDAVNGTVSLDGTTVVYEHDGSETAAGSFTYTVSDGTDTATAMVTVTVTPVNDPPVAVGDSVTVDEGGTLSIEAPLLLDNDADAEDDTLTITVVGDAVNGTVSLDGTTVVYEHDGSETTAGSFTYTVTDGTDTDTATVEVTVTPVNDPPVATPDTAAVDEGDTLSIGAPVLLDNDTDAEDDTLTITVVGDAVNGTVSLDGTTVVYEHDGSETAAGSFAYTASDGTDTATEMVAVTVTPVNDPPVAVGDSVTVDEGDTLSIGAPVLLDNDTDAEDDTLTITAVGDAVNGTVSLDGTTVVYEHDGSETAAGSFTYTVSDGSDTATAMVTVTVTPVNDPPIAVPDTAAVNEGDTVSMEASVLLDNETDAEDDTLTITAVGDAVNGTVSLDGTTVVYEHDGSETAAGSFTYTVSDGSDTATAMVTVTVTPVNDLPVVPLIALALGVGVVILVTLLTIRMRGS